MLFSALPAMPREAGCFLQLTETVWVVVTGRSVGPVLSSTPCPLRCLRIEFLDLVVPLNLLGSLRAGERPLKTSWEAGHELRFYHP